MNSSKLTGGIYPKKIKRLTQKDICAPEIRKQQGTTTAELEQNVGTWKRTKILLRLQEPKEKTGYLRLKQCIEKLPPHPYPAPTTQ